VAISREIWLEKILEYCVLFCHNRYCYLGSSTNEVGVPPVDVLMTWIVSLQVRCGTCSVEQT